tara:strand:- start:294 stop:524 length:231 start_codon:yes stop_codon:yes gene_type:complete
MISYDKLKISEIIEDDGKWNEKKKKYIRYKTPIVSKKVVFEYNHISLEELASEIRQAVLRNPYREIEVTFKAKFEY